MTPNSYWNRKSVRFQQVRDISLLKLSESLWQVITCDSSGGVGPRPHDTIHASPEDVGYWVTKVPLMELLAVGADPCLLVNTLSMPLQPTGQRIVESMAATLSEIGVSVPITGSDEVNIPTSETGVGITLIGFVEPSRWRVGRSQKSDVLFAVGTLTGGLDAWERYQELLKTTSRDSLVASPNTVHRLREAEFVSEILPIGSKGIAWEGEQLARWSGLEVSFRSTDIDLSASAGPADCVLVSAPVDKYSALCELTGLPVEIVAELH